MSKIIVKTKDVQFETAPDLYGLFYEDINRCGDGGLYPEMLRNRAFEDSIPPEGCSVTEDGKNFTTKMGWRDQFNNGEGLNLWAANLPATSIPGWYADRAKMILDTSDRLNANRLSSLKVNFEAGGRVSNIGFRGIPVKKIALYEFYMFAKTHEADLELSVALYSSGGKIYDEKVLTVKQGDYQRYDCVLTSIEEDYNTRLVIRSAKEAQVSIGFTSLMPADTYKGNGMRKDLMEMLAGTGSKFLRFPGGCIVEGFNKSTAMRFSHTIGPVWERPSQVLMWHYRTTNGLGFHEYLQICEDLELEAMYVCNCGMTCQGRFPEVFEGDELDVFLQEASDAIEYAIGGIDTTMGRKRTRAGHKDPFALKYVEIGNENHGPEYLERYRRFYNALKAKYPDLIYIATTHVEEAGATAEIVDEHFYSSAADYATNTHMYDDKDRKGPKIFLGEYAVNLGRDIGNLRAALTEAMFLIGMEKNQDMVILSSYAPLFENVDYKSWTPNLIVFNNHSVYGIPAYHMLGMMGRNRGDAVVSAQVQTDEVNIPEIGLPGFSCYAPGIQIKNPLLNGKPVEISHILNNGIQKDEEGVYTMTPDPENVENSYPGVEQILKTFHSVLFGNEDMKESVFELEVKAEREQGPITLSIWNNHMSPYHVPDETAPKGDKWSPIFVDRYGWTIQDGKGTVEKVHWMAPVPVGEEAKAAFRYGSFNKMKIITHSGRFDCYLNGELIQSGSAPAVPSISAVATTGEEEIILKIVNFTDNADPVQIILDCQVQSDFEVEMLTHADPDKGNSFEEPEAVKIIRSTRSDAAQEFTYRAPAWSFSVLKIKKKD